MFLLDHRPPWFAAIMVRLIKTLTHLLRPRFDWLSGCATPIWTMTCCYGSSGLSRRRPVNLGYLPSDGPRIFGALIERGYAKEDEFL